MTREREIAAVTGEPVEGLVDMLVRDNRRMRRAGCALAEAALHVIREADGLHRLSLAVAAWAQAVAAEGDRPHAIADQSPKGRDAKRLDAEGTRAAVAKPIAQPLDNPPTLGETNDG